MPAAINAMQAFNNYMGFATNWRPNSYYGFVTGLMFWLGVFFEFPLVIYVLTSMGLVKPQVLAAAVEAGNCHHFDHRRGRHTDR